MPTVSDAVVNAADPFTSATVASAVPPSLNVIVPVGVPPVPVPVAVNVTGCLASLGLAEEDDGRGGLPRPDGLR